MDEGKDDSNRLWQCQWQWQWRRQRQWRRRRQLQLQQTRNGNNDKGRVASSCAGNVQHCGRGNTLPPPSWTQRKVHSPALHHGGDTAKSVCSLSRGRVPDSSPWFFFFFTTTVQFTEQPSVCPPHYSGAQEPYQPIDALPLPLLQEPCQLIDDLTRLLIYFLCQGKPGQGLQ